MSSTYEKLMTPAGIKAVQDHIDNVFQERFSLQQEKKELQRTIGNLEAEIIELMDRIRGLTQDAREYNDQHERDLNRITQMDVALRKIALTAKDGRTREIACHARFQ